MVRKPFINVFVVQKRYWWYNDEYDDPVGSDAIQTFRDRDRAEKYRAELEAKIRRGEDGGEHYNPFGMNGLSLSDQTSLSEDELADAVQALGIDPPDSGDWHGWWYRKAKKFTPEQREALWALFDQISFYEVVSERLPVSE
jgi:hypothetical protein